MKKNLFDFINHQMFTLFATEKYRQMNYAVLSFIYDLFVEGKRRQAIPRSEVTSALKDFASTKSFYVEDEGENGQKFLTASDFANFKIRQLLKCGWLEEEPDEKDKFSTVLLLSDGALSLMQAFYNIINQSERPIAYSGYFYTVAMLLKEFDMKQAKTILEQVRKTTEDLFGSLQSINSVIKRFIAELLSDQDATLDSIMETFLYDYQNKVVVTALQKLMGRDNPSTYLNSILHNLRKLSGVLFDEVAFYYSQELDRQSIGNENPLDVAKREARQILRDCLEAYSSVNEFIEAIDERNHRYHRNTKDKIRFHANNRKDVEGRLIKAIKALKEIPDNTAFENAIPLEYAGLVDERSLFSRTRYTAPKSSVRTPIPFVSEKELALAIAALNRQNFFTREKINRYVLWLLGSNRSIRASEIPITSFDELYRLLLIRIYAQYPNVDYTLSDLEDRFVKFNHRITDFVIQRKEKTI